MKKKRFAITYGPNLVKLTIWINHRYVCEFFLLKYMYGKTLSCRIPLSKVVRQLPCLPYRRRRPCSADADKSARRVYVRNGPDRPIWSRIPGPNIWRRTSREFDFTPSRWFCITAVIIGAQCASSTFKRWKNVRSTILFTRWRSTNCAFCITTTGVYVKSSIVWSTAGDDTYLPQFSGRQVHTFCPSG